MNFSIAASNAALNAKLLLANGGFADVYGHRDADDSALGAQPANAGTAITTQTKLAANPLSATAFGDADNRQSLSNAITSVATTVTGYARFVRLTAADHLTGVIDLSVGQANVVTTADATWDAETIACEALTAKVFAGDRLSAGGKVVTLAADADVGAVEITVAPLVDAIRSGTTLAYDLLYDNPHLQAGAQNGVTAITITDAAGY
jgi:hypothetical protein